MTIVTLQAIGLCSHYSRVGDRAFRFGLGLARRRALQLNVFAFVQTPFEAYDPGEGPCTLTGTELERVVVDKSVILVEKGTGVVRDILRDVIGSGRTGQ